MESKFVFWAITSFIGLLFIIMGVLIRTIWNMVFSDLRKRKTDLEKEGGVVTRDKFFLWCEEKQAKCSNNVNCRLCEIEEWRQDMFKKGGPLMMQPHEAICERVTAKAAAIVSLTLEAQWKLMKKELEVIQLTLKNDVMTALNALKEANGKK